MSVLLNIKMPKSCFHCPLKYGLINKDHYFRFCSIIGEEITEHVYEIKKHEDCPLIEIKEPHGRLIDVDELNKKLVPQWDRLDSSDFANKALWRTLDNMPVIIEKEE